MSRPANHNNPQRARFHEWHAPDGNAYPLIDLPAGSKLLVTPSEEDEKCAVPGNQYMCVLAQWAKRTSGGAPAMIGVDKAYIPTYEGGRLVMYRCKVPAATTRAIDEYDRTGKFPLGGFVFRGIPASERQDSERARDKRYRERWSDRGGRSGTPRPKQQVHIRNATRAAQVFVTERAA